MKENFRRLWRAHGLLLIVSAAVILMQTVIGVLLWARLPEQVATHFDMHNQPNGWSSRAFVVFGMPLALLALQGICALASCTPRLSNVRMTAKLWRLALSIIPAAAVLTMTLTYGHALGAAFDVGRIVYVFVGVIFAVTGNYMPKMRRNALCGIRIPWTLGSEENWNRTHRFAAPVWVTGGLLMILCGLIGLSPWLMVGTIVAVIALPVAYSLAIDLRGA